MKGERVQCENTLPRIGVFQMCPLSNTYPNYLVRVPKTSNIQHKSCLCVGEGGGEGSRITSQNSCHENANTECLSSQPVLVSLT